MPLHWLYFVQFVADNAILFPLAIYQTSKLKDDVEAASIAIDDGASETPIAAVSLFRAIQNFLSNMLSKNLVDNVVDSDTLAH